MSSFPVIQQPAIRHTLPKEYNFDGMYMSGTISFKDTLKKLKEGRGPQFDILVATYPRTGTARLLETVWLMQNECDLQQAKEINITRRHTFLETCDPSFQKSASECLTDMKVVKTHLPCSIMMKYVEAGTKVVVGLRNPKDSLISYYHFYKMSSNMGNFDGTFDQFFELFKAKHLAFGDVFDFSIGWWGQRHRENIHISFYEDMSANPFEETMKIAKFLNKNLDSTKIDSIVQWTSFDNMKQQKSTNYEGHGSFSTGVSRYMRSGTVGGWRSTLTEDQSQYIDNIYRERCLPLALNFTFE